MSIPNPFEVKTPEKLSSEDAVSLFVDVFTDYEKVKSQGHTFICGPRGIGKSMIFRFLQPDCQCRNNLSPIEGLDFLGFYIPLRNASFTTVSEINRLENHAACIINEHIMSVYFLTKIFDTLANKELYKSEKEEWVEDAKKYLIHVCNDVLYISDCPDVTKLKSIHEVFEQLTQIMENKYRLVMSYTKKLAFTKDIVPYEGSLYDYLDYMVPAVNALSRIGCFNHQKVFLLIDDAHALTSTQTQVLNYWVSTRTSGDISLKISTQYDYKHYYTITGSTIDTPHDYTEIDMWKVYTGPARPTYKKRITEIVEKRLLNVGITKTAEEFFPVDDQQEKKIKEIKEEYYRKYERGEGRGNRKEDDALRYARPDYIKSLSGTAKSASTYSYAGFEQLVHLSSGVARAFLEDACKMFAEEVARKKGESEICKISDSVQNEVVREDASNYLLKDLFKYAKTPDSSPNEADAIYPEEDISKLLNLINGLGGLFRIILLSDRSERRVFSIHVSDEMSPEVRRILSLGVRLGYFHLSSLGRKDSKISGRTNLYVLNRRLSPIWNLDPTSFAGYLSIKNELLEKAMEKPYSALRRLAKDDEKKSEENYKQISMFSDEETELYTVEVIE